MAAPTDQTDRAFCRKCYYNLRGLDKNRCPECGTEFDPADPRSFRQRPPQLGWRWVRRGLIALAAVALLIGVPYGWLYWGWKQEQRALAKLPGLQVTKTQPLGPAWLSKGMGRGGFVLARVREVDGAFSRVDDISPLATLTRLEVLALACTPVRDLTPLANLTGLRELDVRSTRVVDLTPLARLAKLQILHLERSAVTDFGPLANLTALQSLYLYRTSVRDLSPLASLTELQILDVRDTPVTDVSPLARLTGLRWLILSFTDVRDVAPLANLRALQVLSLRETRVTDLLPLCGLTELRALDLPMNTITEAQVAELQRVLPQCRIERSY